jgi:hypothetical protein
MGIDGPPPPSGHPSLLTVFGQIAEERRGKIVVGHETFAELLRLYL